MYIYPIVQIHVVIRGGTNSGFKYYFNVLNKLQNLVLKLDGFDIGPCTSPIQILLLPSQLLINHSSLCKGSNNTEPKLAELGPAHAELGQDNLIRFAVRLLEPGCFQSDQWRSVVCKLS